MANNSGNHPPLPQEEDLEMGRLELSEDRGPSNDEESEQSEIINRLKEKLAEKEKELAEKDNQLAERDEQLAEKNKKLTKKENKLAKNEKQLEELNAEKEDQLVEFKILLEGNIAHILQTSLKGNYMQKLKSRS